MKIEIITKEDKKITQENVKSVEFYGGSMSIVLTTGESMTIPMYLVDYFNVISL